MNEPEYEVESILRARTVRRGRGTYRQALVKWTGWIYLTREPVDYIKDTEALNRFEEKYGLIENNDGPAPSHSGAFFGPAEAETIAKRRIKRKKKSAHLS